MIASVLRPLLACVVLGGCGKSWLVSYQAEFPPPRVREAKEVVRETSDAQGLYMYGRSPRAAEARERYMDVGFRVLRELRDGE